MLEVNNKNTRTTSMTSFWCFYCLLWTYFTTFSLQVSLLTLKWTHRYIQQSVLTKYLQKVNNNDEVSQLLALLGGKMLRIYPILFVRLISLSPQKKWSFPLRSFLRIWSHLLQISLMENFIFCVVYLSCRIKLWKIPRKLKKSFWGCLTLFFWKLPKWLFIFGRRLFLYPASIINNQLALHKKWSFPWGISLVNVTKSAKNWGFSHTYWKNPQ